MKQQTIKKSGFSFFQNPLEKLFVQKGNKDLELD
jgi:hypothetical protein